MANKSVGILERTIFGAAVEGLSVVELFKRKCDRACFDEIVRRYLPKVNARCEKWVSENKGVFERDALSELREELYSRLCELLVKCVNDWDGSVEQTSSYRHFVCFLDLKANNYIVDAWMTFLKRWRREREQLYSCAEERGCEVVWMIDVDAKVVRDKALDIAYWRLTEKERTVLVERYWGQKSLEQTGVVMSMGRERVRQIEAKAMRKIRERFSAAKIAFGDCF